MQKNFVLNIANLAIMAIVAIITNLGFICTTLGVVCGKAKNLYVANCIDMHQLVAFAAMPICPKGWKLPIAYNSGDWSALKRKYNIEEGTSSNNALYDEPFNYTRSFYVSNRRIAVNGWLDTAYIGPATDSGSFSNFGVTISDNYSGTASITGAEGGSIRCVAR